jgi:predicted cobalt transporter CbtA
MEAVVVGSLVLRGVLVGLVAGLLAFGFAKFFAEPVIGVAIEFESAHDEAERQAQIKNGITPEPEEPEIFSRAVQTTVGLLTGVLGVGAGIGGLFGVLFAFANGRAGNLGPGATSTLLSFYGWWSVYLIPALKYPPNPPAVGEPDTIAFRTGVYFLLMALSIAATIGAVMLRRRLTAKFGTWTGSVYAFLAYLVAIIIFFAILPGINEVPDDFPAVTLYQFRIFSAATQVILWGGIGLMFGWLAEHGMVGLSSPVRPSVAAVR